MEVWPYQIKVFHGNEITNVKECAKEIIMYIICCGVYQRPYIRETMHSSLNL